MNPRYRRERCEAVNELMRVIAGCGRHFFSYEGRVTLFDVSDSGEVWITDKYTQHRMCVRGQYVRSRKFSDGGTLNALVVRLGKYIRYNETMPADSTWFGPWPRDYCGGDLWGYGDDMQQVRDAAVRLGIKEAVR